MKKRIFLSILLLIIGVGFVFTCETDSKSYTEDEQLVLVGVGAFKDGFYDIAEKQFTQYLKSYPNQERVYEVSYLLGKTLLVKGKWSEAKASFLKIVDENKNVEYLDYTLFWLAQVEMKLGNLDGGKKLLQSIVRNFPKFEGLDYSYYLIALLELSSTQPAAAEVFFKKVFLLSKNEELIQSSFLGLGILSFQQKQYETAINYFQNLSHNANHLPEQYRKYALFWLGEAQIKLGRFGEAKSTYETFCQRFKNDPLFPEASWRVGFCEYRLGNLKESVVLFRSFLNQFKDSKLNLYTSYLLGEIFLTLGDYLSSIREINFILNHTEGHPLLRGASLLTLYWNSVNLGEPEEANRILQKLLRLNPVGEEKIYAQWLTADMAFSEGRILDALPYYFNILNSKFREKALFQIGKGYFFEKSFREAIINLDILILEFPNSRYIEEALFMKGEALFKSGSMTPALETFDHLIQLKQGSQWQLFALAQVGTLSLSLDEGGNKAIIFENLINSFPRHPLSYYAAFLLGDLYFKRGNPAEATHYYSSVIKGNFLQLLGDAHFRLGEIYYQQGKYEKAFTSFQTAVQHLREGSLCFFLTYLEMGNLQRRWGKLEDAKKSYRVILNDVKDEEVKKAARELLNRIEEN